MALISMFTHLGGNFCVAASDFVSFKSSRQENRPWPTVVSNFVEVRMKTFIKKDDFVQDSVVRLL